VAAAPAAMPAAAMPAGARELEVIAGPLASPGLADDLIELFREVTGAGTLALAEPLPGQPAGTVRFRLQTGSSDEELLDLCGFHVPREQIRLAPWPHPVAAPAAAASPSPQAAAPARPPRSAAGSETLRVSLDKVDQLINLMGELVIAQAMLAQRTAQLERGARRQLQGGLMALERTTRDLQGSVMAIRMIPMGEVFQRFPRMLRDLAGRLGKQLELRTVGEATELDKGMIEKITDPLTHLVRNSVDHGIELPHERVAAGKPPGGTLTLAARHEGGCIVIEVQDDGRGLDRARILDKARRNDIAIADNASDAEVWQLIFAPGFSTAEAVTDISGRGVGMDVVRRNILGLGGAVELDSAPGRGTTVRVRLPLTLAIMDGISVAVGGELYLLPLASVIESFQVQPGAVRRMPPAHRLVKVRDEYLPVLSLAAAMDAPARTGPGGALMLVLVQAEGRRVVLEVDRLVGQQQVVVKNLEANYQRVPGVSGATIMGDGSVALIVDVAALVRAAPLPPSSPGPAGRQEGDAPADAAATETVPA
jgi:two-component system chemotaxis sensor kinase CheA